MQKYFKIFEVVYSDVETFGGYSDGYGKEYRSDPQLRGIQDYRLNQQFDTELDAQVAIEKYGDKGTEYVIHKMYYVEW